MMNNRHQSLHSMVDNGPGADSFQRLAGGRRRLQRRRTAEDETNRTALLQIETDRWSVMMFATRPSVCFVDYGRA